MKRYYLFIISLGSSLKTKSQSNLGYFGKYLDMKLRFGGTYT